LSWMDHFLLPLDPGAPASSTFGLGPKFIPLVHRLWTELLCYLTILRAEDCGSCQLTQSKAPNPYLCLLWFYVYTTIANINMFYLRSWIFLSTFELFKSIWLTHPIYCSFLFHYITHVYPISFFFRIFSLWLLSLDLKWDLFNELSFMYFSKCLLLCVCMKFMF
jgi:hypothetical protein